MKVALLAGEGRPLASWLHAGVTTHGQAPCRGVQATCKCGRSRLSPLREWLGRGQAATGAIDCGKGRMQAQPHERAACHPRAEVVAGSTQHCHLHKGDGDDRKNKGSKC
ncbi:hypothetical protein BHM03_00040485 [Ensete ventricosum]|nr:hypothetical protein BHM03_00040485 [Ensete ventricosum]